MKGLLIREPWIGRILGGRKTWEMRARPCRHRGPIALIRTGSGTIVGVADVVDSRPSLDTPEDYAAAEPYHAVRPEEQDAAFGAGWRIPWVLANVRPLAVPVTYQHPSGAVTWVNLDEAVAAVVKAQVGAPNPSVHVRASVDAGPRIAAARVARRVAARSPGPGTHDKRVVRLTGGNIRNHHIYLPLDLFPGDAIGGARRQARASRTITVTFSPGATVATDIDGPKRILRVRGAVRDFFARAGLREGDSVLIVRTGPYSYIVSKAGQ